MKHINNGFRKTAYWAVCGLFLTSCLMTVSTAALADELPPSDPGTVVTDPSPVPTETVDPAPVEPIPVDPAPVVPVPIPVVPAPEPVIPAPAPVPVAPAPVAPRQPAASVQPDAALRSPATTTFGSVLESLFTAPAEPPAAVADDGIEPSAKGSTTTAHSAPKSRSASSAAAPAASNVASSRAPAIAKSEIQAAVAVAAGSPFVVQLGTVLALLVAVIAYFRAMATRGPRAPSKSR